MSDLSLQILIEIRDEIRATNARLDAVDAHLSARIDAVNESLSTRIDATNERIDALNSDLRKEMAAIEMRQATRVVAQTAATRDLDEMLSERFDLRDRVEACERDIAELRARLPE